MPNVTYKRWNFDSNDIFTSLWSNARASSLTNGPRTSSIFHSRFWNKFYHRVAPGEILAAKRKEVSLPLSPVRSLSCLWFSSWQEFPHASVTLLSLQGYLGTFTHPPHHIFANDGDTERPPHTMRIYTFWCKRVPYKLPYILIVILYNYYLCCLSAYLAGQSRQYSWCNIWTEIKRPSTLRLILQLPA